MHNMLPLLHAAYLKLLVFLFTGHEIRMTSLCFSPRTQLLLAASDDGHMKFYDV